MQLMDNIRVKKISVIVPVYKTEIFLRRCVESILAQTFSDFEIILIDDGSPDNCGAICDNFAEQYSTIKVIHQVNQGVSAARNAGIAAAMGEWIMFVDSDDWIEPEMLDVMVTQAEGMDYNVDICISGYVADKCDGSYRSEFKQLAGYRLQNAEKIDLYKHRLLTTMVGGYGELVRMSVSVAKLYRKSLLIDNNIIFIQGIMWGEDRLFNLFAIHYAKNIVFCKGTFYHYDVNLSSASNSFKPGAMDSMHLLLHELESFIKQRLPIGKTNSEIIYNNWACMAFLEATKINYLLKNSPYTLRQGAVEVKALLKSEPFKTAIHDADMSIFPRSQRIRRWFLVHGFVTLHNILMIARYRLVKGQ